MSLNSGKSHCLDHFSGLRASRESCIAMACTTSSSVLSIMHHMARHLKFTVGRCPPALDLLQQNIADIATEDGLMLIAGDCNARTGEVADTLSSDQLSDVFDSVPEPIDCVPLGPRQSEDKGQTCVFGKVLLSICQGSDIAITNGRTPGNSSGCFTCHTIKGKSVVDYLLASTHLMHAATGLSVEQLPPESDHLSTDALTRSAGSEFC